MRGFSLTVKPSGQIMQYNCLFGVPTLTSDVPPGSNIAFARVAYNGGAYVLDAGVQRFYLLTGNSSATFAANATTGTITVTLQLAGILQTPAGPSGGVVALGSYTGTGSIDAAAGNYSGSLTGTGGYSVNGTFGGWFFGPQGAEPAFASSLTGSDPTGRPMSINGNLVAFQR